MQDNEIKTVYDWVLACGGQVDFWHRVHGGWFQNICAEEYANRTGDDALGPNEGKLNGVVLTFEMLEALKKIPIPAGFSLTPDDPAQFWDDLYSGKYMTKSEPDHAG